MEAKKTNQLLSSLRRGLWTAFLVGPLTSGCDGNLDISVTDPTTTATAAVEDVLSLEEAAAATNTRAAEDPDFYNQSNLFLFPAAVLADQDVSEPILEQELAEKSEEDLLFSGKPHTPLAIRTHFQAYCSDEVRYLFVLRDQAVPKGDPARLVNSPVFVMPSWCEIAVTSAETARTRSGNVNAGTATAISQNTNDINALTSRVNSLDTIGALACADGQLAKYTTDGMGSRWLCGDDAAATPGEPLTLGAEAITTALLADDAVSAVKVADDAVNSEKIADGTIRDADIATSAAISPTKIKTSNPGVVEIDRTEYSALDGVISNIQAQIDALTTGASNSWSQLTALFEANQMPLSATNSAVTLYVDGNESGNCRSAGSGACATVMEAIQLISPISREDVMINIAPGTYSEDISIAGLATSASITLQGASAGTTIIQAQTSAGIAVRNSAHVTLQDLVLRPDLALPGGAALQVRTSRVSLIDVTIDGTASSNAPAIGVQIEAGSHVAHSSGGLTIRGFSASCMEVVGAFESSGGSFDIEDCGDDGILAWQGGVAKLQSTTTSIGATSTDIGVSVRDRGSLELIGTAGSIATLTGSSSAARVLEGSRLKASYVDATATASTGILCTTWSSLDLDHTNVTSATSVGVSIDNCTGLIEGDGDRPRIVGSSGSGSNHALSVTQSTLMLDFSSAAPSGQYHFSAPGHGVSCDASRITMAPHLAVYSSGNTAMELSGCHLTANDLVARSDHSSGSVVALSKSSVATIETADLRGDSTHGVNCSRNSQLTLTDATVDVGLNGILANQGCFLTTLGNLSMGLNVDHTIDLDLGSHAVIDGSGTIDLVGDGFEIDTHSTVTVSAAVNCDGSVTPAVAIGASYLINPVNSGGCPTKNDRRGE